MSPSVEKGQIWRIRYALSANADWKYAYFIILDIRACNSANAKWKYDLFPLTPNVDNSKVVGYAYPLNQNLHWEFMA